MLCLLVVKPSMAESAGKGIAALKVRFNRRQTCQPAPHSTLSVAHDYEGA